MRSPAIWRWATRRHGSRVGWVGTGPPSAGRWPATAGVVGIGPVRRNAGPMRGWPGRRGPRSPAVYRCTTWCSTSWSGSGPRSRSRGGCVGSIRIISRCRSRTSRSTGPCMCKDAANCGVNWPNACAPDGPSASPTGPARSLLRPAQPLAARVKRELQRAGPAILPQGHRPLGAHRRGPGPRVRRTQRTTPQDPRLANTSRNVRRSILKPLTLQRPLETARQLPCSHGKRPGISDSLPCPDGDVRRRSVDRATRVTRTPGGSARTGGGSARTGGGSARTGGGSTRTGGGSTHARGGSTPRHLSRTAGGRPVPRMPRRRQ